MSWLNAAVKSCEFRIVTDRTRDGLSSGTLTARALVSCLDSWRNDWEKGVRFYPIVKSFHLHAACEEDRGYIERWLHRRGIAVPKPDYVQSFDRTNILDFVKKTQPNVLVKSSDQVSGTS